MFIRVPKDLIELAEIFEKNKEKLYIVGGFIRNQIIGIPDKYNTDIDVCSSALPEKILKMLENTAFKANYMNKELGVLEIENNIRVEHATFREEKYSMPGVHIPDNVKFIKDINKDAQRRDFKCNAIYYDILEKEIVDPLGGVKDIEKKIISTTLDPKFVFVSDAERILRMVRFACTLGFNINDETYEEAKNNAYKLQYISKTRKREEFSRIVLADTKFDFLPETKNAHARGINMLADLGALKYVLPALDDIKNGLLIEDTGKYLFEHIMNVFMFSQPQVRLSALLHDVGKAKVYEKYKNFNGSQEMANIIIESNLGEEGLGYSKKIVERVKNVVFGVDFNKYGFESAKNIRKFIIENNENIELIIALRNAIIKDKKGAIGKHFGLNRIYYIYNNMLKTKAPMRISDLKINGNDIIERFKDVNVKKLSDLLNKILIIVAGKPYMNNKETLLILVGKHINKKKSIYKEN